MSASRSRAHKAPARHGDLDRDAARRWLLHTLGLDAPRAQKGSRGVRAMLSALRCVQLDPLEPIGSNADLVALARVDGLARHDVHTHLTPGHAFEHFAKERCLLPASAFPYYRDAAVETPWWRSTERMRRVSAALVDEVLAEVRERGPVSASELSDRGRVAPLEWDGWKGTSRAGSMALEILWTQCRIVVAGRDRSRGGKLYDIPQRALPRTHDARPAEPFARWALKERVAAAGLLCRAAGATWSMLRDARTSGLVDALLDEGAIEEVSIEGGARRYLAPAGFRDVRLGEPDDRLRILGPLDPVLWDRELVREAFGFDYVWEVYKPAAQRRFGWYVVPLLHRGALVARMEARTEDGVLLVERLWREPDRSLDEDALDAALERHAEALGCASVKRGPKARRALTPKRARRSPAPARRRPS